MRLRVLLAVSRTVFREFIRTPEAVFWTYGFPLVMALGLGVAFASGDVAPVRAVLPAQLEQAADLERILEEHSGGRIEVETRVGDAARRALTLGEFDVLVRGSVADPVVEVDKTRPEAELALFWVERAFDIAAGEPAEPRAEIQPVTDRGSRYIDFLIPGLIGLNLLGAGMYGVGFNVVQMRVRNLLRRLYVTPMAPSEFLLSFLLSRLVLVVPESLFIVLFGVFAFGVPVHGSWFLLCLIVLAGGFAFSGLGLLVACRAKTVEAVSGLINLFMLPMWLLGGCFFSNDRFPDFVQPLIQILPLTHLNDGLRAVMLGGAGLEAVWIPLAGLFGFAAACLVIAVRLFRWN